MNLPLNGRRFTDLSLLTPGVTQDPRGQKSTSNGDLSFGSIRGLHTSYLVDGGDNNNAFLRRRGDDIACLISFRTKLFKSFASRRILFQPNQGGAPALW